MKYLFFDIECSNCFNDIGKMCEFGYVITDENFKILSAYDIPMSPGAGRENRFHLRDRMKNEDVSLAYEEEYYFNQPELPKFYDRIKKLMEDKDTVCFAFSMRNDIRYLFDSCNKYRLPGLNYICYDVQKFAASYLEVNEQPGLKKCVDEIVGPHAIKELTEHLSRDDAKMSMMIMEAICVLNKIDSKTLLAQFDSTKVNSMDFIRAYRSKKVEKETIRELRKIIDDTVKADRDFIEKDEFKGKRYNSSSLLLHTAEDAKKLINQIHQCGGIFTRDFEYTDILIVKDQKDLDYFKEKRTEEYQGELVLIDSFLKMCDGGNQQ